MTKFEKGMVVATLLCLLSVAGLITYVNHSIEETGGMKQVIIDTGKEIKDIKEKINND